MAALFAATRSLPDLQPGGPLMESPAAETIKLERALRQLQRRLHGMIAGSEPWHEPSVELAVEISDWWRSRRRQP